MLSHVGSAGGKHGVYDTVGVPAACGGPSGLRGSQPSVAVRLASLSVRGGERFNASLVPQQQKNAGIPKVETSESREPLKEPL